MVAEIATGLSWFTPIFAFFLVLLIVYAVLKKTEVLGSNEGMMLIVSFIISSFFILESQLVDYVEFLTGWVGVVLAIIFFLLILFAFASRDFEFKILTKTKGVAWVVLVILAVLLIVSTSYVFNWVINWDLLQGWLQEDWFGFILLVALGIGAYLFIKTKE
jgi:hypothetical protein